MYSLWWQQYLVLTQLGIRLASITYGEWSAGMGRIAAVGCNGIATSADSGEDWLITIDPVLTSWRAEFHEVNCAAAVYCRDGFSLARPAANDSTWIVCFQEA